MLSQCTYWGRAMRHSRRQERQTRPKPTALCPHQRSYTLLSVHSFYVILFFFNCRLITLKYCSGFCHTLAQISHRCTCVPSSQTPLPPSSPFHPSGLSQWNCFECPVSCIRLGLVIYFIYGNIHVSMLFSQILPLSPSPTESKSLFFISVSFLLSHI